MRTETRYMRMPLTSTVDLHQTSYCFRPFRVAGGAQFSSDAELSSSEGTFCRNRLRERVSSSFSHRMRS